MGKMPNREGIRTNTGSRDGTAFLLYTLVRHEKPSLVVEVGVADGRSTQVIQARWTRRRRPPGECRHLDEVGGGAKGHPAVDLHPCPHAPENIRSLTKDLAEVGSPDLFFHDGSLVSRPIRRLSRRLGADAAGQRPRSDDVDLSYFIHLVTAFGVKPVVLTDGLRAGVGWFAPDAPSERSFHEAPGPAWPLGAGEGSCPYSDCPAARGLRVGSWLGPRRGSLEHGDLNGKSALVTGAQRGWRHVSLTCASTGGFHRHRLLSVLSVCRHAHYERVPVVQVPVGPCSRPTHSHVT